MEKDKNATGIMTAGSSLNTKDPKSPEGGL